MSIVRAVYVLEMFSERSAQWEPIPGPFMSLAVAREGLAEAQRDSPARQFRLARYERAEIYSEGDKR